VGKASEWRRKGQARAAEGAVELTLPSGMTILARRPDPLQMAMWRRLPLTLAAAAAGSGKPEPPDEEARRQEFLETVEVSKHLLMFCCVSPRISLDPKGEEEIHPREVPMEDSVFILRWAMRREEAEKLRPFRGNGSAPCTGGDGEAVRDAAERAAGDRGSGVGAGSGPGGGRGTGAGSAAGDGAGA